MSQPLACFIIDAFTSAAFSGNPAAVCILDSEKPDDWLQKTAAEFNLSETAFLLHQQDNCWQLRWFTPVCEVNLCGHATLAAAHVLSRELKIQHKQFIFSTRSGNLGAAINNRTITLDFPKIYPEFFSNIYLHNDNSGIKQLGLALVAGYRAGEDIILELANENEVVNYLPDIEKIKKIEARGVILTAPSSNSQRDFVSRFFAPRAGINEDPVTGSAHCSLAVLWAKKLGKNKLRAEQLSPRKGTVNMLMQESRVELSGECVTFLRGHIEENI